MNNNIATWFELPVSDMQRAKNFYQDVLQATFKDDEMGGFLLSIFEAENGAVTGMLVLGEH